MQDQRIRPTSAQPRATHFDELEARTTMRRVQLAVEDGDSEDAAVAAAAWRQAARLAGRLQRQTREIADGLEHA
jgi:hypothetical protein